MPDELRDGFPAERAAIDAALTAMCDRELTDVDPRVRDAIRYGLLGEGKRLRGLLSDAQIRSLLARRDQLLAHVAERVAKEGEAAVLYD